MKLEFAEAARTELEDIEDFIAADDPAAARRVVTDVVHACATLLATPELGARIGFVRRVVLRRLVQKPYLIVYSVRSDRIIIHRIRHGARSPRALLKNLDLR